jgi:hypothetical protein
MEDKLRQNNVDTTGLVASLNERRWGEHSNVVGLSMPIALG